ncbi:MAG: CotH kinase family protein [Oscillospiraceae bacterium]|jgi:hypothetical protein|nr:CotH kinase family protein [Oscillospiraceae bacterium]
MPKKEFRRFAVIALAIVLVALAGCGGAGGQDRTDPTQQSSQRLPEHFGGTGAVVINEYMSKNTHTNYTQAGDAADWAELYNPGASAIDLSGWFLSDDPNKPSKWAFPQGVTIQAGEYLLVWCSDGAAAAQGELHTSFKLGQEDLALVLSAPDLQEIDSMPMQPLQENISCGRDPADLGKLLFFTLPTPGEANGAGFAELALAQAPESRELIISEVSAAWAVRNKETGQSDWVELHNPTEKSVSLKGYGLCKSLDGDPYLFSDAELPPGGYMTVNVKVDSCGERLYVLNPAGQVVDFFDSGKLRVGESSGRAAGSLERVFFAAPTPGKANTQPPLRGYAPKPKLSRIGGYATQGDTVTAAAQGFTLRYTTDGSVPAADAPIFPGEIHLSETLTLRVRAFADGFLPSDTVTATYIIGASHEIPIVSLSSKPDDLFGHSNGIMANGPGYAEPFPYEGANFWKDWEREATLEYYSKTGEKQLEFDAGVGVFGQYTRAYLQKSLAVHLRDSYGAKRVTYPFFENNPITTNTDFVLRAAGQDQYRTKFRDAFCTQVLKGYSDIAYQDWQPVALYINGEYWGLYALREKVNEQFFAAREGLDADHIDTVKGDTQALSGDKAGWRELREYARSHDMAQQTHYAWMEERLDIDNFIDYLIAEIFFANSDTGNKKSYREAPEGANGGSKWRMVLFDFDMTMRSGAMGPPRNTIKEMFSPNGHGYNNMFFTALQCGLLENKTFREKFKARYLELLETAFSIKHMEEVLNRMAAEVEPEIAANAARWGKPTPEYWRAQVEEVRGIIHSRPAVAKQQMLDFLG